jgi:hypothetical protein
MLTANLKFGNKKNLFFPFFAMFYIKNRSFYLNQPIKWADFRLDALLADTMLTKLYTTGP